MLRAPLTFHSPETIYSFLRINVGPLYMLIKDNQALIHFSSSQSTEQALKKYRSTTISGLPFQLFPYTDGDLDRSGPPQPSDEVNLTQNEVTIPSINCSQFTLQMQQSLKVKDPNDFFEKTTKKSRKDLIDWMNQYTPLSETVQNKKNQILASSEQQRINDFQRYYQNGLDNLNKNVRQEFKSFRRNCYNFGKQLKVDLDPSMSIAQPTPQMPSDTQSYRTYLQYMNQSKGLKRVSPLNDEQFVCTSYQPSKGKLLLFKVDDQYVQWQKQIKDGAYGLLVLDNHILIGNNEGYAGILGGPNFSDLEISNRLHKSMIYEIAKQSNRANGYNIMTLSCDNLLKLWNVSIQRFTESDQTVFFDQLLKIDHNNRQISSVVAMPEPDPRIVYTWQKNLIVYDVKTSKQVNSCICKGTILKVALIDDNSVAVANERYISYVDTRNNANTINYRINKQTRTLAALTPNTVFYACSDGEVGLIDRRFDKRLWVNTTNHKSKIYDVSLMGSKIISADNMGQVVSWIPNQLQEL